MDLLCVAGNYGESFFGSFVERLNTSSIEIVGAWIRPVGDPMAARQDVFEAFIREFQACGGMMMVEKAIGPGALANRRRASRWWWWPWPQTERRGDVETAECWLGVSFVVPGGSRYTACYKIPEEKVTFPPPIRNVRQMTPISRQIVRCALVRARDGDDEDDGGEEEEDVLLDLTETTREMAGPDGEFFGRGGIDLRLSIGESSDARKADQTTVRKLISHAVAGKAARVSMTIADGEQLTVDPKSFSWRAK
jgi:hypothetical protein